MKNRKWYRFLVANHDLYEKSNLFLDERSIFGDTFLVEKNYNFVLENNGCNIFVFKIKKYNLVSNFNYIIITKYI